MIQITNLAKQFAGQLLFKDLSFNLQKGERVGLVGRNGSGKSTLFSMILGKTAPDSGEISIPKGYSIGQLEQHIRFSKSTVMEECCLALSEENKYDFYKAEKFLFGLGFEQDDLQKDPASFSGGYQIRINLCKALLSEPDLLLLDEPTNYLDILSLRWLRSFLRSFPGEIILITHDRDFMDSVTTHTMGIYRKGLKKIKGNTHKFHEQMLLEDEIYEKTRANQERKKEHLESFVERFGAKASKASQAQSKMKQLNKMESLDKLEDEGSMGLRFRHQECPGKELMRVDDLGFAYEGKDLLFSDVSFSVGRKDRVGIIGKNGKGKSTLLNLLAGELKPSQGSISSHPSMALGHLGQTNVARLNSENTIVEEVGQANLDLSQTAVRNICGSLMFEGEMAQKKVKVLSGGEKNRVLLGKILANKTNLLLLDEPTNHLDMESIEILSEEICDYPGAVVMVTHSESLLRRVVDRLVVFTKDGAEFFLGGYDEFLEKIGWEEEEQTRKTSNNKKSLTKKEAHALRQELIKERSKLCNPLLKKQSSLEEEILNKEQELEVLKKVLDDSVKSGDNQKILESSQKVGEIEKRIQKAFEMMEEIESELLRHNQSFEQKLEQYEN